MADGIHFERLGVPAVAIVTSAFAASSAAMARLEGAPTYRYLELPHPLSSRDADECLELAALAFPGVLAVLGLGEAPLDVEPEGGVPSTSASPAKGATSQDGVMRGTLDELAGVVEHYFAQGWTDGLPVVPMTSERLAEFLAEVDLDVDEPVLSVDHLGRACSVRLAAVAAGMAGCHPSHFPVVVAAARALQPLANTGLLQSTTGQAVCIIVNGPIRSRLGFNSTGNVLGPGYRANATVGRALRLMVMNAIGVRPGGFDQSTQGTPGKYTLCLAENEETSPFEPLHVARGFLPEESTVTVHFARSAVHVENRASRIPEEVLLTIADAMSYAGALGCRAATVLLGPEHAALLARQGWTRDQASGFLFDHWGRTRRELRQFGLGDGDALSTKLPAPKAVSDEPLGAGGCPTEEEFVHFGTSPESILLVVAGAPNAGISTVIPTHRPQRFADAFFSMAIS